MLNKVIIPIQYLHKRNCISHNFMPYRWMNTYHTKGKIWIRSFSSIVVRMRLKGSLMLIEEIRDLGRPIRRRLTWWYTRKECDSYTLRPPFGVATSELECLIDLIDGRPRGQQSPSSRQYHCRGTVLPDGVVHCSPDIVKNRTYIPVT